MMKEVGFFNKVEFTNEKTKGFKEKTGLFLKKSVEWYFDFGQSSYKPVDEPTKPGYYVKNNQKRSPFQICLKIIECTFKILVSPILIIPMLIGKICFRCKNVYIIDPNPKKNIDPKLQKIIDVKAKESSTKVGNKSKTNSSKDKKEYSTAKHSKTSDPKKKGSTLKTPTRDASVPRTNSQSPDSTKTPSPLNFTTQTKFPDKRIPAKQENKMNANSKSIFHDMFLGDLSPDLPSALRTSNSQTIDSKRNEPILSNHQTDLSGNRSIPAKQENKMNANSGNFFSDIALGGLFKVNALAQGKISEELYEVLPENFISRISLSDDYTDLEKDLLFSSAKQIYEDAGKMIPENAWAKDILTIDYLKGLATERPDFSPIPYQNNQYTDKNLEKQLDDHLLPFLPANINEGPRIYGHALQVNGNHRTAFIIDMDNRTVEFFNSFHSDATAKKPLEALARKLTDKYGVQFNYIHATKNSSFHSLQSDDYQCGIWTCKFIEERVKQGKNFNPNSLSGFDIANYRKQVYAKAYELKFFEEVGRKRFNTTVPQSEHKNFFDSIEAKIAQSIPSRVNPKRLSYVAFSSYCRNWGRQNKNQVRIEL